MTVLSSSVRRHLLLLSNSTNPGGGFLNHAIDAIAAFLKGRQRVLFIPYAGVSISWDAYASRVRQRLAEIDISVDSLHDHSAPRRAIEESEAIVVGGGNTWHLLRELQRHDLLTPLASAVNAGIRYFGWSAGANIACPTIRTTNDMPIVEVDGMSALGLIPFQINPHYTDRGIEGHGGETRPERIGEFLVANPHMPVLGLPEGTWLDVDGARLALRGGGATLFRSNSAPEMLKPGTITIQQS